MRREMMMAYVESLIEEITGADKVRPDAEGDYCVSKGGRDIFVRVLEGRVPVVRVFTTALVNVEVSDTLASELNEINARMRLCRAYCSSGAVVFGVDHIGAGLEISALKECVSAVGFYADRLASDLGVRHGGTRPETIGERGEPVGAASGYPGTGMYL